MLALGLTSETGDLSRLILAQIVKTVKRSRYLNGTFRRIIPKQDGNGQRRDTCRL